MAPAKMVRNLFSKCRLQLEKMERITRVFSGELARMFGKVVQPTTGILVGDGTHQLISWWPIGIILIPAKQLQFYTLVNLMVVQQPVAMALHYHLMMHWALPVISSKNIGTKKCIQILLCAHSRDR